MDEEDYLQDICGALGGLELPLNPKDKVLLEFMRLHPETENPTELLNAAGWDLEFALDLASSSLDLPRMELQHHNGETSDSFTVPVNISVEKMWTVANPDGDTKFWPEGCTLQIVEGRDKVQLQDPVYVPPWGEGALKLKCRLLSGHIGEHFCSLQFFSPDGVAFDGDKIRITIKVVEDDQQVNELTDGLSRI